MKPIQVVARDLFGGVVFNQIFPNLPIAVTSISIFLSMWSGPISQVIIVSPQPGRKFIKTIFKVQEENEGLVLASSSGERILLPEAPDGEHFEGEIDDDDWDEDDLESLG